MNNTGKRKRHFSKDKFLAVTPGELVRLRQLSKRVTYKGNPSHKKNPGDFKLTPPAGARLDKSLCDAAGIFSQKEVLSLLKRGICLGLVSSQERNGFPKKVWAVVERNGKLIPLEAQLHLGASEGQYHGYPLYPSDPLYAEILRRWEILNGLSKNI